MSLLAGSRLGTYQIVAALGAGGMGEVYRATDTRLGRDVAVKILPPGVADDPERLARFEREARTIARLNHPNIVVIYGIEQIDRTWALVMELVEGQDLSHLIRPGGVPMSRVLELAVPLADALAAAHQRGVVHRDLKPANVMVTGDGHVKVLDFGLAKAMDWGTSDESTQTTPSPISTPGQVLGTIAYMAPEQVRGGSVDARSDLFSFGILLFELIAGRRPFGGPTSADLMSSILRDAPPALPSLRADVPADLARIVSRCLEKDPEHRMQSAKDVRNELEIVRRALDSGTVPSSGARHLIHVDTSADAPSIAVLPFANLGRDEADEYFADGITEDVIAQLCKVRTLKVISRSSVMPFKKREESVADIAARLQVATVLEGSVRRIGDRVRIVAQLIDPASGQHIWADTYDRQLTDIFAIQMDVALQIAAALKAELSPVERARIRREPTRDVQAYERYLRGRHCLVRFTPDEMRRALEYFNSAIERDPEFALAHTGIAMAYTELAESGTLGRGQARADALAAAARAIAIDPEFGEAYTARGHARQLFDYDWAGAEQDYKRALELSPNSADTYDFYGRLCYSLNRFDEAIALQERAHELDPLTHRVDLATALLRAGRFDQAARAAAAAVELDPHDPRAHATLGWALFKTGRTGEGIAGLERAVALLPSESLWQAQLGQAYALAGQTGNATAILERLQDSARPVPASSYHLAYVYIGLGDHERALDCLERAFAEGSGPLAGIKGSFLLAPLREHPRFRALLKRMNLE